MTKLSQLRAMLSTQTKNACTHIQQLRTMMRPSTYLRIIKEIEYEHGFSEGIREVAQLKVLIEDAADIVSGFRAEIFDSHQTDGSIVVNDAQDQHAANELARCDAWLTRARGALTYSQIPLAADPTADARDGWVLVPREPSEAIISALVAIIRRSEWGRYNVILQYKGLLDVAACHAPTVGEPETAISGDNR